MCLFRKKRCFILRLYEIAIHDGLTGLYNHGECYAPPTDELTRKQRFNRPVSLLMFDIGHFKNINDI